VHEKVYYFWSWKNLRTILNLLYIIDVPEKVVKAIEATDVVENFRPKVTFEDTKTGNGKKVWLEMSIVPSPKNIPVQKGINAL